MVNKMNKSEKIFVIGHKNPDTDSICSALAYAFFKKAKGKNVIAARAGEICDETRFVLDYFKVKEPVLIKDAIGKKLILVDHTNPSQAVDNVEEADIIEIIDHHRLGGLETKSPLFARIEPVGSTATIVADMFFSDNIKMDKTIAGLLLSALLSDTIIFRAVTTTEKDKKIAKELAKISGLDPEKFGMEIKKAGSSIKTKTEREIIESDFKLFDSMKLGVGQIQIVDNAEINERKEKILKEMEKMRLEKNCKTLMLMVTNILAQDTDLWIVGETAVAEKAFKEKVKNNSIYLKGVMSRKKQIIPPLKEVLLKEGAS